MITSKIHRRGPEVVVAACDKELLGRAFNEGELHLEIKPGFYEGEDTSAERLNDRLEGASVANLVGEETVAAAVEYGFIDESCILVIDGVPHAQMVRM